ncbi:hypothetical protein, partial [Pseudomonas sp. MPR-AND1A]|uniref:hypothetical protein n=1 Tax=Pseudomonas sp. MPR-AND1A TaxID=2070600 RepID=UPI000CB304DA
MRKIILEMGFEIGPNEDPKLDIVDVIKNLQSKMEEDKQGLIKEANGINAEAMRDWLKFKLGLPSKMAEEASTIVG